MVSEANSDTNLLPEYENPPINEVVCGVTFKPLDRFTAAHMGILWERFQPEYPTVEELPPLASPIELFGGQAFEPEIGFTTVPPLPREMFISAEGNYVIQVQRDRFMFNWRKLKESDLYPRYNQVVSQFAKNYSLFEEVSTVNETIPEPIQYELTYVNQIVQGDLWHSVSEIGNVFPNINLALDGLILKEPEHTHWRTSFVLPGNVGRLHIGIRTNAVRKSDNRPLMFFELTVRGMAKDLTKQKREEWFTSAREWIVKGFTDFTSTAVQQNVWRRTQ